MYSTYVPWPGDSSVIRRSSLRRYVFAGPITTLSCGVCSSSMFAETASPSSESPIYGVQTGVLTNVKGIPDFINIRHHVFTVVCLRGSLSAADCGGVDLELRQPIADFAAKERSELPWFVDPVSNKLAGGFDACDSCRLSSGSDIFHWTFVLLLHLAFPPQPDQTKTQTQTPGFPSSTIELKSAVAATDRDPRWGTLTFYESSPDVQRYFCSRCSACVFYTTNGRPELVDLAIGLLNTKNGSRVEELVSWDFGGKMGWRQDVAGGWRESFVGRIEAAADHWRIERGYPKSWRRIQKEEAAG
ncbi:hypothetical protein GQX73_g8088 [Xylaria multiplex]|uniref:CENP-V/GFA domain-containing protein n=1 Tax=Xylaria multiplex TaxID=323545 RepID=A0A7C8IQ09_9PEZI|nr:hypothetical protein GQX73_g8088 [Xylaria multiplex]